MSAPVRPMPSRMRRVLPQMCSRTRAPSALHAGDQPRLAGLDELAVDPRTDERGGRVADADEVGARVDLGAREPQLHLDDEVEQVDERSPGRRRSRA